MTPEQRRERQRAEIEAARERLMLEPRFDPPIQAKRDPRKIVVVLQFYEGDKARAMHLARLISDLQPEKTDRFDFAFAPRWDCTHDYETIQKVSRKFNVWQMKSNRRGMGWPHGCNELACDMMQQAYVHKREGKWSNHKAVYLIESDIMPMRRDWLEALSSEWDEAQAKGKLVMGSWSPLHSLVGHINGNMLFSPDLVSKVKGLEGCPANAGWDCYFGPKFAPIWHKSRLMQNHYDYRSNIPPEILFSSVDGITPVAVVHGVKDTSAERQVRKLLFPSPGNGA
jgi:hypothetical protein